MAKLFDCNCEYQETGTGSVKGYALVSECDVCKARREAENATRLEKEAEEKTIADLKAAAKESFKAKLSALGTFTQEEIDAILG